MTEKQYTAELAKADRIEAQGHHMAAYLAAQVRREAFAKLAATKTAGEYFGARA